MRPLHYTFLFTLLLAQAACVTINITFPPAVAEKAADKIIDKVWEEGQKSETGGEAETPPAEPAAPAEEKPAEGDAAADKQSWAEPLLKGVGYTLELLVAPAHAAGKDLNISTPAIKALESKMAGRHKTLLPYYNNGAVGLTNDALISLRDAGKVPLAKRNKISAAVKDENADRLSLYREIAKANGHPGAAGEIRAAFAKRWISKAKKGWWYQDKNGNWVQK